MEKLLWLFLFSYLISEGKSAAVNFSTTISPIISANANAVAVSPCGGILIGAGLIDYKLGETYEPNERCVWTLLNLNHSILQVYLRHANFAESGDFLEIFYVPRVSNGSELRLINPVPSSNPHCDTSELSSNFHQCRLNSSLVFIVFRTNAVLQGTGFSLSVETTGEMLSSYPYEFEPHELMTPQGFTDYEGSSLIQPRKIVTWTLKNPKEFVLYRFNTTYTGEKCPIFHIYKANHRDPRLLRSVCGLIDDPLYLIQGSIGVIEPLILIYESGPGPFRVRPKSQLRFYWNLEQPPSHWIPVPGSALGLNPWSGIILFVFIAKIF